MIPLMNWMGNEICRHCNLFFSVICWPQLRIRYPTNDAEENRSRHRQTKTFRLSTIQMCCQPNAFSDLDLVFFLKDMPLASIITTDLATTLVSGHLLGFHNYLFSPFLLTTQLLGSDRRLRIVSCFCAFPLAAFSLLRCDRSSGLLRSSPLLTHRLRDPPAELLIALLHLHSQSGVAIPYATKGHASCSVCQ